MTNSKNLSSTSLPEGFQLPLKGFHVEVKTAKTDRKVLVEGMGDGRVRIHVSKIRK